FHATESYSPAGRQIDHTRNEWTNKQATYMNGTMTDIVIQAYLHVWDNGTPALRSIDLASCSITVKPDLPPIAALEVPPLAIRNQSFDIYNKSYSPDGDIILSTEYKFKYDANNNGFMDDAWQPIMGDTNK